MTTHRPSPNQENALTIQSCVAAATANEMFLIDPLDLNRNHALCCSIRMEGMALTDSLEAKSEKALTS